MSPRRIVSHSGFIIVAVLWSACSSSVAPVTVDPPTGPVSREELIGSYDATVFSITTGGETTDLLAAGGSMTLTLEASGQYTGQVSAPGLGPNGTDVSEAPSGAWTYDVVTRTVRFPAGSGFLAASFRPSRAEDPFVILLTGTIPADGFAGTPSTDVVLTQR